MTEEISEVRGVLGKYWDLFLYLVILFVLYLQLMQMSVDPMVDPKFSSFYINGMIGGMLIISFMGLFRWKFGDAFNLPNWAKGVWIIVFVLFISMMTLNTGQMIGVPDSMVLGASIPKESQIYNSAVFPAFGEDMTWLVGLPMGLTFVFLLISERLGFEVGWTLFLTLGITACLISAFVFTSAHQQAYQEQRVAYTGAFIFSAGQSITYLATGVFLPIAHFVHNFLVKFNQMYGINVFGYSISGGSS